MKQCNCYHVVPFKCYRQISWHMIHSVHEEHRHLDHTNHLQATLYDQTNPKATNQNSWLCSGIYCTAYSSIYNILCPGSRNKCSLYSTVVALHRNTRISEVKLADSKDKRQWCPKIARCAIELESVSLSNLSHFIIAPRVVILKRIRQCIRNWNSLSLKK